MGPKARIGILLALACSSLGWADAVRTQSISLHKGWNAVFLEVTPGTTDSDVVFTNTPVSIAATYFAVSSPVQFIQNPGTIQWKREGWGVWYAPGRPDTFLSNLKMIYGNRAYLIYAGRDFTWNVSGSVSFDRVRWKSNSFNFLGFSLDPVAPPTFHQFFASSPAQNPSRVYQLADGQWKLIGDPIQTRMQSGTAYWIYCNGSSDFQGPLTVNVPTAMGLHFESTDQSWLSVVNTSSDPMNVQVQTVSNGNGLPLDYSVRGIGPGWINRFNFPLPAVYAMPSLEPGDSASLWLNIRRDKMTSAVQSTLLEVSGDIGVRLWIPVSGTRAQLQAAVAQ